MEKVVLFFTALMRKYLPDSFTIVILLTAVVMFLAVAVEGQAPTAMIMSWGKGFWSLLAFTTQMAVMLAMGYVLATAPATERMIDAIVDQVHRPRTAIVVATLVGGIGSYLNWGFGLVLGGIIAKKLAIRVKGVHYPLIIAAAYSGFTLYGLGLSASIPLLISTPKHPFEATMGIIPLSQTIFSWQMLATSLTVLIVLPALNAWLHPKAGANVVEISPELVAESQVKPTAKALFPENTIAERLNNSPLISWFIGLVGLGYVAMHFFGGGSLDLNLVNFVILFFGIILLGTPAAYVGRLAQGISTVSGIVLQFPFYAGIMAVMAASGLVSSISNLFIGISDAHTLPLWGLLSSFVINFFAPSAGGHWVIQGPFMIEAAVKLHSAMNQVAMSVQLGNAWNDLVQPFWILPALALSKLRLRDIMGYTVIMMFVLAVIYIGAVVGWGYLGQ
jgi:short-chain fatty acids transporter